MAEETLDLFNRHTGGEGKRGSRSAHGVRRDVGLDGCPGGDLMQLLLDRSRRQTVSGIAERHKERGAIITPAFKVGGKGDNALRVEIRNA